MVELIQSLVEALQEEIELYRRLLVEAESQREALVANRVDELQIAIARQEQMLAARPALQARTAAILAQMAEHLGEPGLTVLEAACRIGGSTGMELRTLRDRILEAAARLSQVNRVNAELLNSGLRFLRFTLGILSESASEGAPYLAIGGRSSQAATLLINDRV